MKLQRLKQAPVLIAACVIALVCLARALQLDWLERLERMTYDMRVRLALKFPSNVATNLGFVFINEDSIKAVKSGELGYRFGLYWPRQVYGRLVQELSSQGAETVAFDVIFGELRGDLNAPVLMANGELFESDDYFAETMRRASNAIIAFTMDLPPPDLFATNALALGDISTDKDSDGILRCARAFRTVTNWNFAFKKVAADPDFGVDLSKARVEPKQIVLPRSNGEEIKVPLDADGKFAMSDFFGGELPPNIPPKAKPFTVERIWHMGVMLAAQHLNLDLTNANIDLERGWIALPGPGGLERVIPVDRDGSFYINWDLPVNDPRLAAEPVQNLLWQNRQRLKSETNGLSGYWRGKLVVVGSSAQGNDLTDRGATPLAKDTLLVSKHWNVANSILTGRFVRRASLALELALIVALGAITAFLTCQWRAYSATAGVILLVAVYCALGVFLYVQYRFWLPLVLPVAGAILTEHGILQTYRVVFEQKERRRVKSIFSRVVSPEVVNELLGVEKLSLGGARREVTVLFADVRGFTELTDVTQERVADYVREHHLSRDAAEQCYEEFARETLNTVNLYLSCVADAVKKHGGTLDKYIGDCVMAFWGAPTAHSQHAVACVRAAIDAQRTMYDLNRQRAAQNPQRELENQARASAGLPPKPPLPTLTLGTGINTGLVTVGLMGSDAHILNYTVFGREVNLASRLEGISGRGRIIVSEATYQHLVRDDPALAATCIEREPTTPKGFNRPVRIYEVPWLPPGVVAEDFQTMMFVKPKK